MSGSPDLETIRREIAALPERLRIDGDDADESAPAKADGPLAVIARQGRLILRLTAASEATETRLRTLAEQAESDQQALTEAREAMRRAEDDARKMAREALMPLMDAIDWAYEIAIVHQNSTLADAMASARRDGLRRLAVLGITQIPAEPGGAFDGRIHESVEALPAPEGSAIPRYAILSLVRHGYQRGSEILRRTTVITVL